jgi:APA family basic amino acid/polyamine antiporter
MTVHGPLDRASELSQRTLGSPTLFAVVYASLAGAIYFTLGVVADRALGLTPVVYAIGGVFFVLAAMTYVEGASMHPERGGAPIFARYAFNELWSFVAAWALLLDGVILVAAASLSAANYLPAFWGGGLGSRWVEFAVVAGIIVAVAVANVRGTTPARFRRISMLAGVDVLLQLVVIVLGLALLFDAGTLIDPIDLGRSPRWMDVLFALTLTAVAYTGLESAAGLVGEVEVSPRGLKRLVASSTLIVIPVYVGLALVALVALPVRGGATALGGRYQEAPVLGVVRAFDPAWLGQVLGYVVAAVAFLVLLAMASGATLGLSRLGYNLATSRQIPSAVGRLHPRRGTPYVLIGLAAALAVALVVPLDLDFLVGIYAFGAMLAFTLAHLAVCVLRYREPERPRPYRVPLSVRVGRGELPLPAVLGAVLSLAGWVSVLVLHQGARYVGSVWMVLGVTLYVVYRKSEGRSVVQRLSVPETALRAERPDVEYGSILVPISGSPLDDDIMQTAGRLAGEEGDEDLGRSVIEAIWVFEIPLSLPIDAQLPEEQLRRARAALARAKAVGEEYDRVEVATATVRARRLGQAIVDEARRRGVEAIVLAAEEPTRIRGGPLLGGRPGGREQFVGETTKYVLSRAPCRVIITASPAEEPDRVDGHRPTPMDRPVGGPA